MLRRLAEQELNQRLAFSPAVVLLGARQVGKSTLGRALQTAHPAAVFLDLENPSDRAKLTNPEAFWQANRDRLIILDEVQTMPELFSLLRPEIDAHRVAGRFLLLGSASGALLKQSAESLAGRVSYLELPPLLWPEVMSADADADQKALDLRNYWTRGGMPPSFVTPAHPHSARWRRDYLHAVVSRDLPMLGVRVPSETLWRFIRMLAHCNAQIINYKALGESMGGISPLTSSRYLDLFCNTFLVRRLEPYFINIGKRLVKSPKVYWRDTGLLHALLGIHQPHDLLSHPSAGASWEALVINHIAATIEHLPETLAQMFFYRTAAGAELDALVETSTERIGFEVKLSETPKPSKGFWNACRDLQLHRAYVVAPVNSAWPLDDQTWVIPLEAVSQALMTPGYRP
ncbi:MAG: ATP-binding protein [Limnohabitans sp.]|nr:ATP-binding protein [Limnohabitans sp.]